MLKDELKTELPIKLEELLNFTLNFDNLIKGISYLHNNEINIISNIRLFERRISILEELKRDISDIKIQAKNLQNSNENLNRSIQTLQERFNKMDSKFNESEKKIGDAFAKLDEHHKKLDLHDSNLSYLNKVVEDNIKKANKLDNDVFEHKKQMSVLKDKEEELRKKDESLEKLIMDKDQLLNKRIDENRKDIVKLTNSSTDLNSLFINLKKEINIKNNEFQNSISNIISHITSGKGINISGLLNEGNSDSDNTGLLIKAVNDYIRISSTLEQVENEQKLFKEFINKYHEENENCNNNIKKNKNKIEIIQNEINDIKQELELVSLNNGRLDKNKMLEDINLSNYATTEMLKKANDNIRILSSSLGCTPTREEYEASIKKINLRLQTLELIQQGISTAPKPKLNLNKEQIKGQIISFITRPQNKVASKDAGEDKNINEIKKLIMETINEEIKNLSLMENPKFSEIFESIQKIEEEISKNDNSIINIRNILAVSPTQNDLLMLRTDLERLTEESKKKFNEIIHNISGDEDEESEDEGEKTGLAGFCIKKKIAIIIGKFHDLTSKLNSLQNKNNILSREIKEEVKQNLKIETLKVVEEFKLKLDNFTTKFEVELKNKIDRGGLTLFEDKLNSRIKGDLKEKLDRNELKKNNNQIKRKIDSLENKISKTLVDTIIDLQMDEAPLLLKKNYNNYDLCASCNQPIKKDKLLYTERNFYKNSKMNNNTNSSLSSGRISFRNKSNNNNQFNLKLSMNRTNSNFNNNNSKLPGLISYTQSK